MLNDKIAAVLELYEKDQPRRATGGIYAMSGFNYQLNLYVAQLVESLTSSKEEVEQAGNVFIESLSDLAITSEDNLVCIQVKRTLTVASLKSSAAEFVAIENFFEKNSSVSYKQVRFRLVASRGDSNITWSKLSSSDPSFSIVKRLISEFRLEEPAIEADPSWRAITSLWPHMNDPYGFMRFAINRALTRTTSSEDAQRIRDDICERYKLNIQVSAIGGELLQLSDFEKNTNPATYLDIGREITLARMRDQQYMHRSQRLETVYKNVLEHFDSSQRVLQSAVQVFWLAGRSGVGKSVLLLQTVERLVTEGRRVLWLGGKSELLENSLRAISEAPEELRPEFIVIDDLYDRDARERLDLGRLSTFIDERGRQAWPLLLTCGPNEFATAFEDDARYRGFEVHLDTLPPLESVEAEEVTSWYRIRTGKEPARGEAFTQTLEDDGGLFISLAVELEHGDLREFSRRFADRTRINKLEKTLCLPLALNRLYLRTPYDWLSKNELEHLASFNNDGDFKIIDYDLEGRVIRLTHPHLADALYLALRKPANSQAYTNDLIDIFTRALADRKTVLISQLLRLFSGENLDLATERLSIIDGKLLAEGCSRAWNTSDGFNSFEGDVAADIATSWICWANRQPEINVLLGNGLLDVGINSLNQAHKVWSFCWWRLSEIKPFSLKLFDWANMYLPQDDFISHPMWSLVWEKCFNNAEDPQAWHQIALNWLQLYSKKPDWHFVWKKLLPLELDADWACSPSLQVAFRRLHIESEGPDWAFVLQDLFSYTTNEPVKAKTLWRLGCDWLVDHEDRAEWPYIYRFLLKNHEQKSEVLALEKLLEQGSEWLSGREEHASWAYIFIALLENADHLPDSLITEELLEQGCHWLIGHEDRSEWAHLWRKLFDNSKLLSEPFLFTKVSEQGYRWLDGREDRVEWKYIWQSLLENTDQLPESLPLKKIVVVGYGWLENREELDEWNYIWRDVLSHADSVLSKQVLELGYHWLTDHYEHDCWGHVWQILLVNSKLLPESLPLSGILEEGYNWLIGREEVVDWAHIWQDLLKHSEQLPESLPIDKVLAKGYSWLSGHDNLVDWPFVWQDLLNNDALLPKQLSSLMLLEQGYNWLNNHQHSSGWGFICEKLLEYEYDHPPLISLAVKWLEYKENEPFWIIVVMKFMTTVPDHPYSRLVAMELTKRVHKHPNLNYWIKIEHLVDRLLKLVEVSDEIKSFCEAFTNRSTEPVWELARELIKDKAPVQGKILLVNSNGSLIELDIGLFGTCLPDDSFRYKVGERKTFYIWIVEPKRNTVRLSHLPSEDVDVEVDGIYQGVVSKSLAYGCLINIGMHTGLLHSSDCIDFDKLKAKYISGSSINVRVLKKTTKGLKLQYADEELEIPLFDISAIQVGQIFDGTIKNIVDYGLFIDIGGMDALLHRSKLSSTINLKTSFKIGEKLEVQVDDLRSDGKISIKPISV